MSEEEEKRSIAINATSSKAQPLEFRLLAIDNGEQADHGDVPTLIPESDSQFLESIENGTIIPLSIRRDYDIHVTAAQISLLMDYAKKQMAESVIDDPGQGVEKKSHQREWIVESRDCKKTIVQKVGEYQQRVLSALPKPGSLRRALFALMGKDKGDQK